MLATIKSTGERVSIKTAIRHDILTVDRGDGTEPFNLPVYALNFDDLDALETLHEVHKRYGQCPFPMVGRVWPVPPERQALWTKMLNAVEAEHEKAAEDKARRDQQIAADRLNASIRKAEYDARFSSTESRLARKASVLAELALLQFSDAPTSVREMTLKQELEWLSDTSEDIIQASPMAVADLVAVVMEVA